MKRLGLNMGGYHGEVIDIQRTLDEIHDVALRGGWLCDAQVYDDVALAARFEYRAYRRVVAQPRKRVFISTGIHGDEPAGPLAALALLRASVWPEDVAVWLCPCVNPMGFVANRRENLHGIDLNRDFRHLNSSEIRTHANWIKEQPGFDVTLCLHEDWESSGFYLYELNPEAQPSFAREILKQVGLVCPIDLAPTIENWPADQGLIHPPVTPETRPLWPESIFLISCKTRLSYTVEAPSDFPMETRIAALVTTVRTVLEQI